MGPGGQVHISLCHTIFILLYEHRFQRFQGEISYCVDEVSIHLSWQPSLATISVHMCSTRDYGTLSDLAKKGEYLKKYLLYHIKEQGLKSKFYSVMWVIFR